MGLTGPQENGEARGVLGILADTVKNPASVLLVSTLAAGFSTDAHAYVPNLDDTEDSSTSLDSLEGTGYDDLGDCTAGTLPHTLTGGLGFQGDGCSSIVWKTSDGINYTDVTSDLTDALDTAGYSYNFSAPVTCDYSHSLDDLLVWDALGSANFFVFSGLTTGTITVTELDGSADACGSFDAAGDVYAGNSDEVYEYTTSSPTLYYSNSSHDIDYASVLDASGDWFAFRNQDTERIYWVDGTDVTDTSKDGVLAGFFSVSETGDYDTILRYDPDTNTHHLLVDLDSAISSGEPDADEDGVTADEDCDDGDAGVGGPGNWYMDGDTDGFGSGEPTESCDQPSASDGQFVELNGDCNDEDEELNPNTEWYPDADRDGLGAGTATTVCEDPSTSDLQYVRNNDDPDDSCHKDDTDCSGSGTSRDEECDLAYNESVDYEGDEGVILENDIICDVAENVNEGSSYAYNVDGANIRIENGQIIRDAIEDTAEFTADENATSILVDEVAGVKVEIEGRATYGLGVSDLFYGTGDSAAKSVDNTSCVNTEGVATTNDPELGVGLWDIDSDAKITVTDLTTGTEWTFNGSELQGQDGDGVLFLSMPEGYTEENSAMCVDLPNKQATSQTPTDPSGCSSVPFNKTLPTALLAAGLALIGRRRKWTT